MTFQKLTPFLVMSFSIAAIVGIGRTVRTVNHSLFLFFCVPLSIF
jgi:hypothetical protein